MAHENEDAGAGGQQADGGEEVTEAAASAELGGGAMSPYAATQQRNEEFLTVAEAALVLKTSRSTLYRHIDEGKVGGWFYLGDEIRFSRTALLRWAEDEVLRSRRRRRRQSGGTSKKSRA